jgi:hypothetical protein
MRFRQFGFVAQAFLNTVIIVGYDECRMILSELLEEKDIGDYS